MVFIAQYVQLVAELTPLWAGLALLPGMAAAIVGFQVAPLLARRIRPAFLFAAGLAVAVGGMLIVTQADAAGGLTTVMIGFATTSIGAGAYRSHLPAGTAAAARDSITSAIATAQELGGSAGDELLTAAQQAFTSGLHTVAAVSAALLAALAVLILARLRHLPSITVTQDEAPEAKGAE